MTTKISKLDRRPGEEKVYCDWIQEAHKEVVNTLYKTKKIFVNNYSWLELAVSWFKKYIFWMKDPKKSSTKILIKKRIPNKEEFPKNKSWYFSSKTKCFYSYFKSYTYQFLFIIWLVKHKIYRKFRPINFLIFISWYFSNSKCIKHVIA